MYAHMRTFARPGALSPKVDRIVARSPKKGTLRELLSPLSVPRKHTHGHGEAHTHKDHFFLKLETRDVALSPEPYSSQLISKKCP